MLRLERRDADVAVELRTPWLLVSLDQQPQEPVADVVPRRRALAAAPMRQVVGKPPTIEGQRLVIERISNSSSDAIARESRRPVLILLPIRAMPFIG